MSVIFVISAPTGVGKTTLCDAALEQDHKLKRVVTHTTRNPRPNEENGIDYYFVNESEFKKGLRAGEFVEYAIVHGNYYGTSKKALLDITNIGNDALLAIDVKGARNVVQQFDNVVSVFLLPPSFDIWIKRITKDNIRDDIDVRLTTALYEIDSIFEFDYCVVNDKLDLAVKIFMSIVNAQRNKMEFVKEDRQKLVENLKKEILKYLED
jgi:guanylate kinase